ncbi:uncharacterized protein I303_103407 [Kwoniella dejecticola CBS 10117]
MYTSFDGSLPASTSTSTSTAASRERDERSGSNGTTRLDQHEYRTQGDHDSPHDDHARRMTSYEYDDLFIRPTEQRYGYDPATQVISPKPRRPIDMQTNLERYHH